LSGKRSSPPPSSNKKIIIYAIIGIVAVAGVSATFLAGGTPSGGQQSMSSSQADSIAKFKAQFCGPDPKANSNTYVAEKVLPSECQMPLSLSVDNDGRVWYVSTKQGILGSYSLADNKFAQYQVPQWPVRDNSIEFNMSWATKIDSKGNVWFTDNNELLWRFNTTSGTFDMFKTPATDPISFDFDSDGNIYLVGVRSKSLFFGDLSKMKPGTAEGFTEIKLPLDAFAGIDNFRISSGSVTVDRERNVVWTSVLAFQLKGVIYKYDVEKNQTSLYNLPQELTSPVGMTVDKDGNLWGTDHGTSIFFMLDPSDGKVTEYTTSVASPKIFGGTMPPSAYTLPYWIATAPDGRIWFNQHEGNKISVFDKNTKMLTEYWIPSQNKLWANCPDNASSCGIANALQMSVGPQGQVWFTEWSENKIGTVKTDAQVPFTVSIPNDEVTVKRGDSAEIKVNVNAQGAFNGSAVASGTFTLNGALGNSTGIFSEQNISIPANSSKQVSFVFTPAGDLAPGQYTLMLGAQNDEVSVLKAVRVDVV
jgi:virginiamycin B lyase